MYIHTVYNTCKPIPNGTRYSCVCLSNQVGTALCLQIYNLTQNIQEDDLQHLQVHLN